MLLLQTAAASAGAAELAGDDVVLVQVHNVRDARGHVLVALCTPQSFLSMRCPYESAVLAQAGTVTARLTGVPPGTYAVEAFDDFNDTRNLGTSFLGLPEKGLGFSRDAKMHFGPPRFSDAAFAVNQPQVEISLTLRYYR